MKAQFYQLLILMSFVETLAALDMSPCSSCNQHHGKIDRHKTFSSKICSHPCKCPPKDVKCPKGVYKTKDGCGCCWMCSLQIGQICDEKRVCDVSKNLKCDMKNLTHGNCKARAGSSCVVNNKMYLDGQKFNLGCRRRCTCQNGNYGCVDMCPQELEKPSESSCKNAKLTSVAGRCCKEWSCDSASQGITRTQSWTNRMVTSFSSSKRNTTLKKPICKAYKGSWSSCSTTCGIGTSMRMTNDRFSCLPTIERRLCFTRSCDQYRYYNNAKTNKCVPTERQKRPTFISFKDCTSIRAKRLKMCGTCNSRRYCCFPKKTKTIYLKFRCSSGLKQSYPFQLIKRCRCKRRC